MYGKIKNKHRLKQKEIKSLLHKLDQLFTLQIKNGEVSLEVGEFHGKKIIFYQNKPSFIFVGDEPIFTVYGVLFFQPKNRYVVVDMGSLKFITNGADVMAPGIVDVDREIKEGDQVWICDERHKKPLAVGIALMDGDLMISKQSGKSVKIHHYIGDEIWNMCQ